MKKQGIALVTALVAVLLLAGISALIVTRTLSELRHSRDDYSIVRALMLARGGANATGALMASQVREKLREVVKQLADTSSPWAFGEDTGQGYPEPASTASDLQQVAATLQQKVDAIVCTFSPKPDGSTGVVRIRLYFTNSACGKPLPRGVQLGTPRFVSGTPRTGAGASSSQTYALPFILVSEGSFGPYRRNIVIQGEYRFVIGRASFAKYALFTNVHSLRNGTNVWFTNRTLFDGPVHTNNYFKFYRKPWFGGEVTSAGCRNPGNERCLGTFRYGARFYGEGFIKDVNMQPDAQHPSYTNDYGTHAPEFTNGVDWRASFIPLPINNNIQKQAAKSMGLYFPRTISDLKLYTGVQDNVKYQYIIVKTYNSRGKQVTRKYRYSQGGFLERWNPRLKKWMPVLKNGQPYVFNGVIFTEKGIQSVHGPSRSNPEDPATAGPALADFAAITIAASNTIRITGDLKYENPPCSDAPRRDADGNVIPAKCDNLSAKNVLGVYSQNGDVLIGRNAPVDIHIDGVLMSARGVVQVEDFRWIQPKGHVYLTGGIIEYYYGAFGTFNAETGRFVSGYGRKFTYDKRMALGLAPPFFPTTSLDDVTSVTLFSYGQREQVY